MNITEPMTAVRAPNVAASLRSCAVTVQLAPGGLSALLPGLRPSGVWLREGLGMIGLGAAVSTLAQGANRFQELAAFWNQLHIDDEASGFSAPGQGPVAFTALAFSATSPWASRLAVPEVLIGADETGAWVRLTRASVDQPPSEGTQDERLHESARSLEAELPAVLARYGLALQEEPAQGPPRLRLQAQGTRSATGQAAESPGTGRGAAEPDPAPGRETAMHEGRCTEAQYLEAVAAGVSRISAGEVDKLVLSRDVLVTTPQADAPGPLLARLASDYSDCWTYWVGGEAQMGAGAVLGATPEMLVRLRGHEVSSRVLAGTVDRAFSPADAAAELVGNAKQTHEHRLAVNSLVRALEPITFSIEAPEKPQVLSLPNVYHLATDVQGTLVEGDDGRLPSPLRVAQLAHPTAAVCGTPTAEAGEIIEELEGLDRGPFAGPVGWLDRAGNADFGIALRGAVVEPVPAGEPGNPRTDSPDSLTPSCSDQEPSGQHRLRLFAGCGIVSDSVPEEELAETHSKLRPMLTALELL